MMDSEEEIPAWAKRLSSKGAKTKFTHPAEYREYLNSNQEQLRQCLLIAEQYMADARTPENEVPFDCFALEGNYAEESFA